MSTVNQLETSTAEIRQAKDNDAFDILTLLTVLAKHKKLIIRLPLAVAVATAALSFAIPNSYRANTKLLPPQQSQSSAAALLSQLGGVDGAVAGSAGLKKPSDLYVGMLKSRTVANNIIAKYHLKEHYDVDSDEKARTILEDNTAISSGKEGLINIEVQDKSQKLVPQIANSYYDELVSLTKTLAVTEASQRRLFFERQLELAKNNLASAEMRLKSALDTHGVVSVDADSRVIVETVGRLRALIASKEIQLNSMRAFVTNNNPAYKRVEEELASLRNELEKQENGRAPANGQEQDGGKSAPGLENIKVLRDVKYFQMLYELLAKQYEAARLDEAKDSSIIQVLDRAVEPERKFKPKRALIVLFTAFMSFVVAVLIAFSGKTAGSSRRRMRSAGMS